jgi:transaldolase
MTAVLAALVRESHVTGVTSNPRIFEQAISNGRADP